MDLERAKELLKSDHVFDLACAYTWIIASSPDDLAELSFTYRELSGMAEIVYLNCI